MPSGICGDWLQRKTDLSEGDLSTNFWPAPPSSGLILGVLHGFLVHETNKRKQPKWGIQDYFLDFCFALQNEEVILRTTDYCMFFGWMLQTLSRASLRFVPLMHSWPPLHRACYGERIHWTGGETPRIPCGVWLPMLGASYFESEELELFWEVFCSFGNECLMVEASETWFLLLVSFGISLVAPMESNAYCTHNKIKIHPQEKL